MNIWQSIQKIFYNRRKRKCNLTFPLFCKVHGVKFADRQGSLAQSRAGDELQIVHTPTANAPFTVHVYSIPLNRVIGYLDERLAEKLVYLFGKDFCRDGKIEQITGGAPTYKYYGCNLQILETKTMMNGYDDFSHLYGG